MNKQNKIIQDELKRLKRRVALLDKTILQSQKTFAELMEGVNNAHKQ